MSGLSSRFLFMVLLVLAGLGDLNRAWSAEEKFSGACQPAKGIVSIVNLLKKDQGVEPVWKGFKVSRLPLLIFDSESKENCGAYQKDDGKIQVIRLSAAVTTGNGLYNFCGGVLPKCSNEIEKFHTGPLLVYDVSGARTQADGLKANLDFLNFSVIAHEGFHFFGQILGSGKGIWTTAGTGLQSEGRNAVETQCYALNNEVEALRKTELETLFKSFYAMANSDLSKAKEFSKEFLNLRKRRYDLVKSVRIPFLEPQGIECHEAENRMEMDEGIANFIGHHSILNIGAVSLEEVVRWIEMTNDPRPAASHYYRFGELMMLILFLDSPDLLQKDIKEMVTSTKPLGVVDFFQRWADQ